MLNSRVFGNWDGYQSWMVMRNCVYLKRVRVKIRRGTFDVQSSDPEKTRKAESVFFVFVLCGTEYISVDIVPLAVVVLVVTFGGACLELQGRRAVRDGPVKPHAPPARLGASGEPPVALALGLRLVGDDCS